jgi:KaiC/GvpD/RAD55 family RecA-like ATPase
VSPLTQLQEVPPKNIILLVGPPGAGKSYFCYQTVLNHLAIKKPIIFVTTEHAPSDIIQFLIERGLKETHTSILYFVDAFHGTVNLTSISPNTVAANCGDLTSLEIAISKLKNKIDKRNILIVFDSLTSPYLLNGQDVIKFLRFSMTKYVTEGNSILVTFDEGCGSKEDLGAIMSVVTGIVKIEVKEGSRVLTVVKHPVMKPTTISTTGMSTDPYLTGYSLKSLNDKLDWIVNRLNFLESVLIESQQYPEAVSFLRSLKIGTAIYGEPLKTLDRLVFARRVIESVPQQDEITKIILNTIALKGPRNISQLTREVQYQRGKASRTTIRKRVKILIKSKTLIKKGNNYHLINSHFTG